MSKMEIVYTDAINTQASSAIETALYNRATADLLVVWRHSPAMLYVFHGIPKEVYDYIVGAPSLGSAISTRVVGVYRSTFYDRLTVKLVWRPDTKVPTTAVSNSSVFTISPVKSNLYTAVFTAGNEVELTFTGTYAENVDVVGSFNELATKIVTKGSVKLKSLVKHFD